MGPCRSRDRYPRALLLGHQRVAAVQFALHTVPGLHMVAVHMSCLYCLGAKQRGEQQD